MSSSRAAMFPLMSADLMAFASALRMSAPAWLRSTPDASSCTASTSALTASGPYSANAPTIVPILGTMFSAAVESDVTRSPVSCSMSALSLPRPVSQFFHAARAMLTLPSIVEPASFADVPAMPSFF